jgi:molybdenum cofactor guanylyltransferase
MGKDKDKAFLEIGGKSLLAKALELAGTVSSEVRIVGDMNRFLPHGPVIEDIFPQRGPLGGIHAALRETTAELNLMLAVDLPLVEPRFLAYLAASASQCLATVTVPVYLDKWQPLCAVYRRDFAAVAERSLAKGKNRIDALLSQVETRKIGAEELERMGFSGEMFLNVNTPEQFERARIRLEAAGGSTDRLE